VNFENEVISWAVSEIPEGKIIKDKIYSKDTEIILKPLIEKTYTSDDFKLKYTNGKIYIMANNIRAFIYGLLEISNQMKNKEKKDKFQKFPFKTRNYKHEIRFVENKFRQPIYYYSEDFWESFCKELLKRGFNGIVFYPGTYHVFQYLLDYNEFPEARVIRLEETKRNQQAFNKALSIAKKYGLNTFVQNYVTHFTENFSRAHKLPFYNERGGRLAGLWTKETIEYSKYCYKEIFRVCPDLSGLYMNFESVGDAAYDFMEEVVISLYNNFKKKPILVLRWGINVPERVVKLIKSYKGKTIYCHKIMDRSDTYYYPCADTRAIEWKRYIGDTEFMFEFGPCHNCGTNIDDLLWCDPEFIYKLLTDAKRKGADSISFHSVTEFLAHYVSGNDVISKEHKALAWMNYFHLDTLVRFFKNEKFNEKKWIDYYKTHFNVKGKQAMVIYKAIKDSSQIVPLVYQQFHHTSAHEGFQIIGRYNFIQEPFFYYPCSFLNYMHKRDVSASAWLNKKMNIKVCPNTYQWIIDYANPSKKKTLNNPFVIAEKLRKNAISSLNSIKKLTRDIRDKRFNALLFYAEINYAIGMWISEEIKAGIDFYKCYFSKSKVEFIKNFKRGLSHLVLCKKYLNVNSAKEKFVRGVHCNYGQYYDIDKYIKDLERVLEKVQQIDFPFSIFKKFVDSRKEYNEIRRNLRPYEMHSPKSLKIASTKLAKALKICNICLLKLKDNVKYEYLYKNVKLWSDYLEYEIKRLQGDSIKVNSNENKFLNVDNCFRYSQHFYTDFDGFFSPYEYVKSDKINFSVNTNKDSLLVSINQFDCNVEELESIWEKIKGNTAESWFLNIIIDTHNDGKKGLKFVIAPKGRFILRSMIEFKHRQYLLETMHFIETRIKTQFKKGPFWWTLDIKIPYNLLGKIPKEGEVWGLNIVSNTCMGAMKCHTWRANYEPFGNIKMMGKLIF